MSPLTNTPKISARPLNLGSRTLPKSLYISHFNVSIPNHQISLFLTYNPPPSLSSNRPYMSPYRPISQGTGGSIYSKNTAIKPFKPLTKYTKYSQTLLPSKMYF